jgi:hypothetical protein
MYADAVSDTANTMEDHGGKRRCDLISPAR